jgi:monofunctional glycosyltransferase
MKKPRRAWARHLLRGLALLVLCTLALQATFALRIALMRYVDPASTTFQRSEAWRLLSEKRQILWSQEWVGSGQISEHLKRAVIASEDAGFVDHGGVEWDAIKGAWGKNQVSAQVAKVRSGKVQAKLVGGSTITQQLAKNLLLSGERTVLRKGQELLITLLLEALLSKERILEIYLNHVEWGEGLFGAQAAARHYFGVDAARLSPLQAARLAVMLPAPKRFEKQPASAYVLGRAAIVMARMGAVDTP